MDLVPLAIELLPERLHHQLLQVAAEQTEPILVRQDHHILRTAPLTDVMPHQGE